MSEFCDKECSKQNINNLLSKFNLRKLLYLSLKSFGKLGKANIKWGIFLKIQNYWHNCRKSMFDHSNEISK